MTLQTEEPLQGVVHLSNLSTALRIDVGTLSEGVYLLELATDKGTAWEKLMIKH